MHLHLISSSHVMVKESKYFNCVCVWVSAVVKGQDYLLNAATFSGQEKRASFQIMSYGNIQADGLEP